ncbi:type 1 fimbrial protein [Cronobacter dublinensis]|nr:type 1 fimbrial protein [Cronobacter dublinensis]
MYPAIMSYRMRCFISRTMVAMFALCYTGLCFAERCVNADDCRITVSFKGKYMEETCDVSINNASSSETITLPTLSTTVLQKAGNEAGSQQFSITLKHCPVDKTVMLSFVNDSGYSDNNTGNLINNAGSGYSENVQIRLRKTDGTQMIINDDGSAQPYVIPATGEDITHYYIAAYYATGDHTVTPGEISTIANIDLVYK